MRLGDRCIAPRRSQNEIDRRSTLDTAKHDGHVLIVQPDLLLPFAACHEMSSRDHDTLQRDRYLLAAGDARWYDPPCLYRNDRPDSELFEHPGIGRGDIGGRIDDALR